MGHNITLTWNPNPEPDIKGYHILKNNTGNGSSGPFHHIKTMNEYSTKYEVTNLSEETTYYFRIIAFDNLLSNSTYSKVASSKTLDVTPPSKPTGLSNFYISGTQVDLTWNANPEADIAGYSIYMNDTGNGPNGNYILIDTVILGSNSYNVFGLKEEITYHFKIRAFDEVPNNSSFSDVLSVTTLDKTAPKPPYNLIAKAVSNDQINLSWNLDPEPDQVGFYVYMNDTNNHAYGTFHIIQTIIGSENSYAISGLLEQISYHFKIKAFDEVPNNSSFSNVASATTFDVTPPDKPTGLIATAVSDTEVNLQWDENTESDIEGYLIFINDTNNGPTGDFHLIHTIVGKNTNYKVTDLNEKITYYFRIKAYDEVPNYSIFSKVASATTPDLTHPSVPTGLIVSNPTENSLTLSWNANPENDVIRYILNRGSSSSGPFIEISFEPIIGTQVIDTGLKEEVSYYYKIKAVDDADLESEFSNVVSGTTILGQYAPEINNSIDEIKIAEDSYNDQAINLYYLFKDKNDEPLNFRYKGQKQIKVTIFQDNGMVILVPEKNWNGQETISFFANDSKLEISKNINVIVTPVNDPPGPAYIVTPDEGIEIYENETLDFEGDCNDPDLMYGDKLTFKWSSNITGEIGIGEHLKDIQLPIGIHQITLEVEDTVRKRSSTTVNISVLAIIDTPENNTPDDNLPATKGKGEDFNIYILIIILIIIIIIIIGLFLYFRNKKHKLEAMGIPEEGQEQVLQPVETNKSTNGVSEPIGIEPTTTLPQTQTIEDSAITTTGVQELLMQAPATTLPAQPTVEPPPQLPPATSTYPPGPEPEPYYQTDTQPDYVPYPEAPPPEVQPGPTPFQEPIVTQPPAEIQYNAYVQPEVQQPQVQEQPIQQQPTIEAPQPQQQVTPTPTPQTPTPTHPQTQPQQQTQPLTTPCPLCNQQIAEYSNPCPHCGGELEWGDSS